MGWQDRKYSGTRGGGGFNLMQLLGGSVTLGQVSGITIRVHATLILFIVFDLLFAGGANGVGFKTALTRSVMLFGLVLLHEFGHCFAARKVGGDAREILLWPLGGLAYVRTPQRPWPSFVATAGGPLVNLIICVVTGAALMILSNFQARLSLNPLLLFSGQMSRLNDAGYALIFSNNLAFYLFWIYTTSLSLLVFNLLPIFPLDGGRMFQEILWPRLGFYHSMNVACSVGMAGAILLGLFGLTSGNTFLLVLGVVGFMTCRQTQQQLPELSQAAHEDGRYSGNFSPRASTRNRKKPARPHDDKFTLKSLNPLERIARARRKKKFERLMKDD